MTENRKKRKSRRGMFSNIVMSSKDKEKEDKTSKRSRPSSESSAKKQCISIELEESNKEITGI